MVMLVGARGPITTPPSNAPACSSPIHGANNTSNYSRTPHMMGSTNRNAELSALPAPLRPTAAASHEYQPHSPKDRSNEFCGIAFSANQRRHSSSTSSLTSDRLSGIAEKLVSVADRLHVKTNNHQGASETEVCGKQLRADEDCQPSATTTTTSAAAVLDAVAAARVRDFELRVCAELVAERQLHLLEMREPLNETSAPTSMEMISEEEVLAAVTMLWPSFCTEMQHMTELLGHEAYRCWPRHPPQKLSNATLVRLAKYRSALEEAQTRCELRRAAHSAEVQELLLRQHHRCLDDWRTRWATVDAAVSRVERRVERAQKTVAVVQAQRAMKAESAVLLRDAVEDVRGLDEAKASSRRWLAEKVRAAEQHEQLQQQREKTLREATLAVGRLHDVVIAAVEGCGRQLVELATPADVCTTAEPFLRAIHTTTLKAEMQLGLLLRSSSGSRISARHAASTRPCEGRVLEECSINTWRQANDASSNCYPSTVKTAHQRQVYDRMQHILRNPFGGAVGGSPAHASREEQSAMPFATATPSAEPDASTTETLHAVRLLVQQLQNISDVLGNQQHLRDQHERRAAAFLEEMRDTIMKALDPVQRLQASLSSPT